jgi:hypothetical protein
MKFSLFFFLLAASTVSVAQAPAPPWQMQESGTTAGLRGIDSVDGTVAWTSGTGGTVLRTIDGGAHWAKCAIPDAATDGATLDFRGVQAWDATTAIVMASGPGEKSRLYKTMDGCKSWTLIFKNPLAPDGFFDCFFFPAVQNIPKGNDGFGLLLGDPVEGSFALYETRDHGAGWNRVSDASLNSQQKNSGAFAASNNCVSGFGGRNFGIVVAEGRESTLFRIAYLGGMWLDDPPAVTPHFWKKVPLPISRSNESSGPFSLSMISRFPATTGGKFQFAVVVGGDYSRPNEGGGTAAWSNDGGWSWTASTIPPHGFRSAVQWSESLKLWLTVGTNGSDISRDDGKTWQPLDNGNWNALSLPFVVGPNGRIARLNPAALLRSAP